MPATTKKLAGVEYYVWVVGAHGRVFDFGHVQRKDTLKALWNMAATSYAVRVELVE